MELVLRELLLYVQAPNSISKMNIIIVLLVTRNRVASVLQHCMHSIATIDQAGIYCCLQVVCVQALLLVLAAVASSDGWLGPRVCLRYHQPKRPQACCLMQHGHVRTWNLLEDAGVL
jgi:hypothetical protein